MDWYLQEFARIVKIVLGDLEGSPELKALIMRPEEDTAPSTMLRVNPVNRNAHSCPWEDWLKEADRDRFFVLKRLRFQANEIWASGSADSTLREKFTTAVETEYKLSIWAAGEYLKAIQSSGFRVMR